MKTPHVHVPHPNLAFVGQAIDKFAALILFGHDDFAWSKGQMQPIGAGLPEVGRADGNSIDAGGGRLGEDEIIAIARAPMRRLGDQRAIRSIEPQPWTQGGAIPGAHAHHDAGAFVGGETPHMHPADRQLASMSKPIEEGQVRVVKGNRGARQMHPVVAELTEEHGADHEGINAGGGRFGGDEVVTVT